MPQAAISALLFLAFALFSRVCLPWTCAPDRGGYDVEVRDNKIMYYYYRYGENSERIKTIIESADPRTFIQLRRDGEGPCVSLSSAYAKDKSFVYYKGMIIEGANPSTFRFLTGEYARDNVAIYSRTKRLTTKVDAFRLMPKRSPYATDGEKYFYNDNIFDEPGFQFFRDDYPGYARTATKVYLNGQPIQGADADTFEPYNPSQRITRDKNFVYFDGKPIPNADPNTFVVVGTYTFKDKRAVYLEGKEVAGADPGSVRLSEHRGYVIDEHAVYKQGKPIPNRDPKTFSELQYPWTKDKNGIYYQDMPFEADLSTFRATALMHAVDKNYMFYGPKKICKFDPANSIELPLCQ